MRPLNTRAKNIRLDNNYVRKKDDALSSNFSHYFKVIQTKNR